MLMRNVRALMLGITLVSLVVAALGYLTLREIRTPAGNSTQPIEIVVEPGDTTAQIATKLRTEKLIRQPLLFNTLVKMQGLDGLLQAGTYVFTPAMTMSDMIIRMQYNVFEDVEVTIFEGMRLEEIAAILQAAGIGTDSEFIAVARNGISFRNDYAPLASIPADASLEGYLFPDTYRFATTATVTDVVRTMLSRFAEQFAFIEPTITVPDVSIHDIVTMASVVQREAALVDEMPKIAAVFWNRLKPENIGETGDGKLQADPTVQYALGYSNAEQTWWRKDLTFTELKIDSPYNTREYPGLPPGPICSPGAKALHAAATPDAGANYLYFVASCKMDGSHNFATNFVDFQQFEAEFQSCSQ